MTALVELISYKAIELIVDVLLVFYGYSMIVVLLSGFSMPFRATVYEGHSSLHYMVIIFFERQPILAFSFSGCVYCRSYHRQKSRPCENILNSRQGP